MEVNQTAINMIGELKEGITIITPTGDRKLALLKCIDYINRQTLQPTQWVIGDNGEHKTVHNVKKLLNPNIQLDTIYNQKLAFLSTGKSFTGNLLQIIPFIQYNKIIIFEDDDWYHPEYVKIVSERLDNFIITGEIKAVYYNIFHRKYRENQNTDRASLCQTAFRGELLVKFKKYCSINRDSAFVDSRLWKHCRDKHIKMGLFEDKRYSVGMKGLLGRKGVGIGHRPGGSYKSDPRWEFLIRLIGLEDAQFYIRMYPNK